MTNGEKCGLCGTFYEYRKTETWTKGDVECDIAECEVAFAIVQRDRKEILICETCYIEGRMEPVLSRSQLRGAFYQFGLEFSKAGEFDKARSALMKSLEVEETADSVAALAYVEEALGHRMKAVTLYQKALAIQPEHFMAKANLKKLL